MDIFNPPPTPQSSSAEPPSTLVNMPQQNTTNNGTANEPNNNNNSVTVTIDTKQMQSELDRRQQELEMKAAELAAREEALRQGGGDFRRQHNWPPLPSFCPLKPCFFQDINIDIRPEFQRTVQLGYHLWIGFVFTILLNVFAGLMMTIYSVEGGAPTLWFAIMLAIFCIPLTYMSWFRPLYKAFKNDSSFNFMVFFFVFFLQTFFTSFWATGLASNGPVGLIVAMKNTGVSILLTLILFIVAAAWITYAVASAFYLLRVHSIYRSSGASMAKARNEFAQGIISNQYVQQTVANAARSTVNQTFAAATGQQATQPAGVR